MSRMLTEEQDVESPDARTGGDRTTGRAAVRSLGITRPDVSSGARRWIAVALVMVLAAALAVLALANRRADDRAGRAEEARRVGAERIAALLSYTPETVSSDLDEELGWLGGDFHDDYAELVDKTIAPAATKAGITVKASVVASGIEKVDGDRVTLLLFVNVDTSTKKVATPRLTGSRIRVGLERRGDDWSIVSFTPLQGAEFALP